MTTPRISIITSTYNSSSLLKYAILSVLNSDFTDWEMIIVGDYCTDDTENVVQSFKDGRIRFTNLDRNSGQQATPSNVALSQVRGDYISYLNQDDMYFPWHLGHMLKTITAAGVDIICAGHAFIETLRRDGATIELAALNGPIAKHGRYSPTRWYLASTWFMTADAARDVGRWRLERELYVAPSQEWMFRAWKMGKHIACPSDISLLLILSGKRPGSYRKKDDALHSAVYESVIRARNPQEELEKALARGASKSERGMHRAMRWAYDNAIGWPSMAVGIHPDTIHRVVRFGIRRGGGVKSWQRAVEMERAGDEGD